MARNISKAGTKQASRRLSRRERLEQEQQQFMYASMNQQTMLTGPQVKKKWSTHDMMKIQPRTLNQSYMMEQFTDGQDVLAVGTAGTGKSFIATVLAMKDVLNPTSPRDHIIYVRSVVSTREVGHLPGTLEEKQAVYETPYSDIVGELFGRSSTYNDMKAAGLIKFMTTSFVRGLTWDNAVVIVDEAQNMTQHELNSIQTRIGENTRVIICGDTKQNDLMMSRQKEQSGLQWAMRAMSYMPRFRQVTFTPEDIVRSEYVAEWIKACERLDEEDFQRQHKKEDPLVRKG